MKKLAIGVMVVLAFVVGCAKKKPPATPDKKVAQVRHLKDFSQVAVKGNVNVLLKKSSRYKVVVKGMSKDVAKVKTDVRPGGLLEVYSHEPAKVEISLPVLSHLAFVGHGQVEAKRFSSSRIDLLVDSDGKLSMHGKLGLRALHAKGKGKIDIHGISSRDLVITMQESPVINLSGVADLKNLKFGGNGRLKLQWVDSGVLNIRGKGSAVVELAGIVRDMNLKLFDKAQFEGRYLRVKKGMIETNGSSIARVFVLNSQSSMAKNGSTIYYYHEPKFMATHMAQSGAVLDMTNF